MKAAKEKKCRECGKPFMPSMTTQAVCGIGCAIAKAKKKVAKDKSDLQKVERKHSRARVESVQPLSYYHKKAQAAFNGFIRERDAGQPCISCGRNTGAKMNAGHYRTVGASKETRYDEDNCHLQCEHCNSYLSGNIGEYRPRLIEKIGHERFDKLVGPHEPKKWTREDLIALAEEYRNKTRDLVKSRSDV
jgi:hypothetical protein